MDEKERLFSPAFKFFSDNYPKPGSVKYIAHWVWWENNEFKSMKIGKEREGGGLVKLAEFHPDQLFWKENTLKSMPAKNAAIVTDCKLLPCAKNGASCAYSVPTLVGKILGKGIPMAVFCHNDVWNSEKGQMGYYTESGASEDDVDDAMSRIFKWSWDKNGDTSTY